MSAGLEIQLIAVVFFGRPNGDRAGLQEGVG